MKTSRNMGCNPRDAVYISRSMLTPQIEPVSYPAGSFSVEVINTPPSNTGVKLPEPCQPSIVAGTDWTSCTFPRVHLEEFIRLVECTFKQTLVRQKVGWKFYTESYKTPCGVLLADKRLAGETVASEAYLSLPAGCLNLLEPNQQASLFAALHRMGAKCTRLDVRIDDYEKTVTIEEIAQAAKSGNFACFRSFRIIESGIMGNSRTGGTVEFGRRGKNGTGKFFRSYDKGVESGGKFECIRHELELSGERSANCFAILAQAPSELWPELIGGWIRDAISFVDRSVSDRLGRCPLLGWWEQLIGKFNALSLSVERPKTTIEKAKKWLQKQVAPTIAFVCNAIGSSGQDWDEWFTLLMDAGEKRMNDFHRSILGLPLMQNRVLIDDSNDCVNYDNAIAEIKSRLFPVDDSSDCGCYEQLSFSDS